MNTNTLYLIDASIYIFRAWHMLPDSLLDRQRRSVNAVYGFADFLIQILQHEKPQHLICAFDESHGQSVRHRIFAQYKANRPPAPENLKYQFAMCREICRHFGIAEMAHAHYEADDIIGVLANSARDRGFSNVIVTADKDLTQFIGKNDIWWNFARKQRLGYEDIIKRFKLRPAQIPDMLALAGDKVDNIPGVPGIGNHTAARLLIKWGNLETLFAHLPEVAEMKFRGAKRSADLLRQHEQTVWLARQLTGLHCPPDLNTDLDRLKLTPPEPASLQHFLDDLNMSQQRQHRIHQALNSHQRNKS